MSSLEFPWGARNYVVAETRKVLCHFFSKWAAKHWINPFKKTSGILAILQSGWPHVGLEAYHQSSRSSAILMFQAAQCTKKRILMHREDKAKLQVMEGHLIAGHRFWTCHPKRQSYWHIFAKFPDLWILGESMARPTTLTRQASSASSAWSHKADQASAVQCNKGFQVKGYMNTSMYIQSHCISFKGFLNRQFQELWKIACCCWQARKL